MAVIAVNDVVIAHAAIAREVQNQSESSPKAAWDAATRALVVRELLLQRARSLELAAEPRVQDGARETEEDALIRTLLEREVKTPKADETTCRRYYDRHQERFRSPDLFEPTHILFKAARGDAAAYQQALERAEAALADVTDAPQTFEALARAVSQCPSATEGGRLGQITRGETTPEFEEALLSLEPGTTCTAPVQTRYGVHVVRLDRKVDGEAMPFEAVRERIAAYLEQNSWQRAVHQYVTLLAGQARIAGCSITEAVTPLVQ